MSEKRDPLDRLADLSFPEPQEARMRADIARARARFVESGLLQPAPRRTNWFTPLRLTLGGSVVTAGLASVVFLGPLAQGNRMPPLAEAPPTLAGAAPEADLAPAPAPAPVESSRKSASAAPRSVTIPDRAEVEAEFPPLAAAPPPPPSPGSVASDTAAEVVASGAGRAPGTTLPRLGARPRPGTGDAALVDMAVPDEDAVFSGSEAFTVSGDQDGLWLERESGRLAIPIDDTEPGMSLQMHELFLLPASGGLPGFLAIRGKIAERQPWQIFRVEADAVRFDRVLTGLVREARTPGQVEAMLRRLPPPD